MDPTHLRPRDVRPVLDPNVHPLDNPCYETMFAARINNLLEARQGIYKQLLLDELHRLRHIVVSATHTAERRVPDAPRIRFSRSRDAAQEEQLNEQASDMSSPTTSDRQKSLVDDQHSAEQHETEINPSLSVDASPGSPVLAERLPVHPELAIIPSRQAEKPSSPTFGTASASTSSSLEINIKRFPAIGNVVSAYRHFNEMNISYCATVSPFFVTLSAPSFSASAQQDQLDPIRTLNLLHSNSQSHEVLSLLSDPFPTFPNSLIFGVKDRLPAPFHRRGYIPSLLARLFFELELALLMNSQFRYTYSAESVSLDKAREAYIQELFPNQRLSSISHTASGSSQLKSPQPRAAILLRGDAETTSGASPSAVFHLPHRAKAFQSRTFYRSMSRTAELRAPAAAWRDDKAYVSLLYAPPVQSHHAYAVSSDARGLPSYISSQGVHSGQHSASATLTFGFQRRTNHPFRNTYPQTRSVGTSSAPPKIPPRVSQEFASRVPVTGLSSTLLHLFQPDVYHGLFFSNVGNESSLGLETKLERKPTKSLYSISAEGKLLPEKSK